MPLPILNSPAQATPEALVRYFHQTERRMAEHLGEIAALDVGTAIANPALPNVHDANVLLDAGIPQGMTAVESFEAARNHFDAQGSRWWKCVLNPSIPLEQTAPLAEHLLASGYTRETSDILYLDRMPSATVTEAPGVKMIPARASYRHARQLAEEMAAAAGEPQLAEVLMLDLDDPHWDAVLALVGTEAAGHVGVLAVGEIGRIETLLVSEKHRRRGIGRTLMSRALEICARSLFKHIFLSCRPANAPAQALYAQLGFRKIGDFVEYRALR
ncbi:MAG TPA: GNAT family N-acetyltransferase [Tepidisphaeraceae bacterium]|nr:GNAT family N-acetyltransferase [Tepidisphaeraceae bacterium]